MEQHSTHPPKRGIFRLGIASPSERVGSPSTSRSSFHEDTTSQAHYDPDYSFVTEPGDEFPPDLPIPGPHTPPKRNASVTPRSILRTPREIRNRPYRVTFNLRDGYDSESSRKKVVRRTQRSYSAYGMAGDEELYLDTTPEHVRQQEADSSWEEEEEESSSEEESEDEEEEEVIVYRNPPRSVHNTGYWNHGVDDEDSSSDISMDSEEAEEERVEVAVHPLRPPYMYNMGYFSDVEEDYADIGSSPDSSMEVDDEEGSSTPSLDELSHNDSASRSWFQYGMDYSNHVDGSELVPASFAATYHFADSDYDLSQIATETIPECSSGGAFCGPLYEMIHSDLSFSSRSESEDVDSMGWSLPLGLEGGTFELRADDL
ncbi:hypothetical protein BDQ17DRAFT_1432030 [Cyathus striatus]|nr:hypothetical protein BDQ17DRAFT_1432030 [Cyathus striatus]